MTLLEYAYAEEAGSSFTHDGIEYDLNCVLAACQNIPANKMQTQFLVWLLSEDSYFDEDRVAQADLDAPILVTRWWGRVTVLDGFHRLVKAHRMGVPLVNTVLVPESFLTGCAI